MEETQDIIYLSIYLGFPVQLVGALFALFRLRRKRVLSIISYVLLHYIISIILTIAIWLKWPFHCDIMLSFLLLPSLIAECILLFIAFVISHVQINK